MAGDQVIYLEKFIESTVHVPPELQRLLNTIKDLDERSEDLGAQIQDNVEVGLQGKLSKDEAADLLERIEADQKLLIQFAEEKVALAMQGYDLLDSHLVALDADAAALAEELQASVGLNDGLGDGGFGGGVVYEEPTPAPRPARLRELSSYDSLDAATDIRPGRRVTLGISRQASEDGTTPIGYDGMAGSAAGRRPPSSAGRRTPLASGLGMLPGADAGGGHLPKRRAASAAVHAAAAAVAAMDEDEGLEGTPTAMPGLQATPAAFTTPLIPGFDHAAEQPQAPGRLLMASDIGPGLVGRRAELYWPDNNLWYLIQIQAVTLASRSASILYTTGEVEELDLDEIVKEGHLSLITSLRAGGR